MEQSIVQIGAHGERQERRLRPDATWSDPDVRDAFLAQLAVSCNVMAAARSVGSNESGAYGMRRRNAQFREAWRAALEAGRERMWDLLLKEALARLDPPEPPDGAEPEPCDPSLALRLYGTHAPDREKRRNAKAERRTPLTADELRVLIEVKLSNKNKELGGDG